MKPCAALCTILLAVAGCRTAKPPAPAAAVTANTPQPTREFVDLEPGWRLRILAPITKSGAYRVQTSQSQSEGNSITLKASDDLIGYETSFFAVDARPRGGVALRLTSAGMTRDGIPSPIAQPTRALVTVPSYAHYLRIFYLTRKSDADHEMAVAGVGKREQLDSFTVALRSIPVEACRNQPRERIYCEWIPAGMAVRPEIEKTVNGEKRWVDRF